MLAPQEGEREILETGIEKRKHYFTSTLKEPVAIGKLNCF